MTTTVLDEAEVELAEPSVEDRKAAQACAAQDRWHDAAMEAGLVWPGFPRRVFEEAA